MIRPDVLAGRYAIERLAASGGMATLYQSRDLVTGDAVAIKVLHGPNAQTPRATARFLREAKTLQSLRHPAIVRYLDHGTDAHGRPFLVMDWLDGASLDIVLGERGLAPGEALTAARRVAEALAHCHAIGIVHRDVKPSNIVLVGGAAEGAVLVDFGIARGEVNATRATETGMVLGTPRYMAPEQLRSARNVDGRADVFGLGCALYESLTGKHPFGGDDVYGYATRLAEGEALPARDVRPELPESLSSLVARMIAREASSRPRIDDAFLAELSAAEHALHASPLVAIVVRSPSRDESDLGASGAQATMATHLPERAHVAVGNVEPEVRGPVPSGRFIGRGEEHAALLAGLSANGAIGVVWGAPGIGKSRLAFEACSTLVHARAARSGSAGFIVDLRSARDRGDVVRAVCSILLSGAESAFVAEGDVASVGRMLRAWGEPVIVLDGADHVQSEVAEIAHAWGNARVGATVIITTRGQLRIAGAVAIELGRLPGARVDGELGAGVEVLLAAASVGAEQLGEADVRAATQIVEALDGNPLALELAATRISVLGFAGLAERLEEPLAMLSESRNGFSMRDALEWSFRLLPIAQQRALAECSVFCGAFTVRAAEAVLSNDASASTIDRLTALRQSSLIGEAPREGDARLILARTVRELASSKLTKDERAAAVKRRNAYLASEGWARADDVMRTGSATALAQLADDAEELLDVANATLGAPVVSAEDAAIGLKAAVAIEQVILTRGPVARYLELLDRGIAATTARTEIAGHARKVRGRILGRRGAEEAAQADLEEACAIARECGAAALEDEARLSLGVLHHRARRLDEAARSYEAIVESSGGQRLRVEASALANLAAIAHDARRFDEALALYEDSLALLDTVGDVRNGILMRINSAILLHERGERLEARARYARAVTDAKTIRDDRLLGIALTNLGMLEMEERQLDHARLHLEEARSLGARAGDVRMEAITIGRLAAVLAMRGQTREALAAAVLAERKAARQGLTIRGPVRLLRAFVDIAQARAAEDAGNLASAESARMAARARIREATTAPSDGGSALVDISDDARAALRVLDAWMAGDSE